MPFILKIYTSRQSPCVEWEVKHIFSDSKKLSALLLWCTNMSDHATLNEGLPCGLIFLNVHSMGSFKC